MGNLYGRKVLDPEAFARQTREVKTSSKKYGWKVIGREEEPKPAPAAAAPTPPAPKVAAAPPPPLRKDEEPTAAQGQPDATPAPPAPPADQGAAKPEPEGAAKVPERDPNELSIRKMEIALEENRDLVGGLLAHELQRKPMPRTSALSLMRKAEKGRSDGGRHEILKQIDEAIEALDTAAHTEG